MFESHRYVLPKLSWKRLFRIIIIYQTKRKSSAYPTAVSLIIYVNVNRISVENIIIIAPSYVGLYEAISTARILYSTEKRKARIEMIEKT